MLSLATTAAGGAIASGADVANLPQGMPSGIELMWWTVSSINAGIWGFLAVEASQ